MLRFLFRRTLSALGLLFVVSVVSFTLIKAPPGDYADYAASLARSQGGLSYEQSIVLRDQIRERLGLNEPLPQQYARWITGMVLRGDFGTSYVYNKPVGDLLYERFWRTLAIALTCHVLATLIGVGLGIVGAVYQHRLGGIGEQRLGASWDEIGGQRGRHRLAGRVGRGVEHRHALFRHHCHKVPRCRTRGSSSPKAMSARRLATTSTVESHRNMVVVTQTSPR